MEEIQKKKFNVNQKMLIAGILAIVLIITNLITFYVISGKKKTNAELANIANMGLAASNDEGVFYNKYEEGIVKVKGTQESQITNETAYAINLLGNDIYYLSIGDNNSISIKKVKTNGSEMTTIKNINTAISKMYVEDNAIFYASNNDNSGIAKLNLDGTDERVIISNEIRDFEVVENKIYYTSKTGDLYTATTNGTEIQRITPKDVSIKEFQVKDNWIYYYDEDDSSLHKVKTDGTENQLFSQYVSSSIFNTAKDKIYFFDEDNKKIASINYNGENYKEITRVSTNKTKINVVGDTIYYLDASSNESKIYQMYRIKTNGSAAKVIKYDK